jgi:hypothetical protein
MNDSVKGNVEYCYFEGDMDFSVVKSEGDDLSHVINEKEGDDLSHVNNEKEGDDEIQNIILKKLLNPIQPFVNFLEFSSKINPNKLSKPIDIANFLGNGYKIQRGRGRIPQYSKMSSNEKKLEALYKLEKNKKCARDCRIKKKNV